MAGSTGQKFLRKLPGGLDLCSPDADNRDMTTTPNSTTHQPSSVKEGPSQYRPVCSCGWRTVGTQHTQAAARRLSRRHAEQATQPGGDSCSTAHTLSHRTVTATVTLEGTTVTVESNKPAIFPSWTFEFPTLDSARQAANAVCKGFRDTVEGDHQARLRAGLSWRASHTEEGR